MIIRKQAAEHSHPWVVWAIVDLFVTGILWLLFYWLFREPGSPAPKSVYGVLAMFPALSGIFILNAWFFWEEEKIERNDK